jgi:hypothetical protein
MELFRRHPAEVEAEVSRGHSLGTSSTAARSRASVGNSGSLPLAPARKCPKLIPVCSASERIDGRRRRARERLQADVRLAGVRSERPGAASRC